MQKTISLWAHFNIAHVIKHISKCYQSHYKYRVLTCCLSAINSGDLSRPEGQATHLEGTFTGTQPHHDLLR